VTLSPGPHIRREPIGMLVLPLLTAFTQGWAIGWASAPYDPVWAERYPRRAAIMAAAGPAGNFLIALAVIIIVRVGIAVGGFDVPGTAHYDRIVELANGEATFGTTLLSVLLIQNVFLGVFNLLPLPPLDGSAVLPGLLPERYALTLRGLRSNGAMSMVGLIVAWQVFPAVTSPLFSLVLRILYPDASYS
jgi:Zn-dependent protease